ncbi:MAG: hypothetical protein ACJAZ1_002753 [Yoonia sp.]|jgi:hypothetical protein
MSVESTIKTKVLGGSRNVRQANKAKPVSDD